MAELFTLADWVQQELEGWPSRSLMMKPGAPLRADPHRCGLKSKPKQRNAVSSMYSARASQISPEWNIIIPLTHATLLYISIIY